MTANTPIRIGLGLGMRRLAHSDHIALVGLASTRRPIPTSPFAQRRIMAARSAGSPLYVRSQSTHHHHHHHHHQQQQQTQHQQPPPAPPAGSAPSPSSSAAAAKADKSPPKFASPSSSSSSSSSPPPPPAKKTAATKSSVPAKKSSQEKGSGSGSGSGSAAVEKSSKKSSSGDGDEDPRLKDLGVMKRTWHKVKEEAQHYWHGTKLLGKEIKISGRLLRRLLMGYNLTRREHRQLKRTMADLLRLIPFAPFIIIPFGELLLPVAIKIFPNMLPSTFESKFAAEEKRRSMIKVRLEMAKFLQGTIREGGIQATDKVKTSDEFKEFFRKVRATGEQPSSEDIIKVAKLFDDDLTLDNLTRPQLVSMCRYMQINAFGTDNYLRYQIRHKLNRLRRDDIVIQNEGTDHMSLHELQSACQSRGIQTLNLDEERLREELRQWIELHIKERISGTLLILSKAFNYMPTGDENASSQLRSLEVTLSSLPDNLINEAELNMSKDSATNKQRLEVLQQQEELIEDEAEQEAAEEEARQIEKRRREAEKARLAKEEEEAKALLPQGEIRGATEGEEARDGITEPESEQQDAGAAAEKRGDAKKASKNKEGASDDGSSNKSKSKSSSKSKSKSKSAAEEEEELKMTNEQLTELGEALSLLSAKSSVLREREELAQLIREVSSVPEEGGAASHVSASTSEVAEAEGAEASTTSKDKAASDAPDGAAEDTQSASEEAAASTSQSAASRSLAKRVRAMLEKIDQQLEEYEHEVGSRMHIIEASPTGKISVDDLEQALRLIRHRPSEDVLERLVDSMDKDKDGLIPLQEVVALAQQESGLGIVREDSIRDITGQGQKLGEEARVKREDIVKD